MPKLITGRTLINLDENKPHVVIPSYVYFIADRAFYESGYILEMTIPDNVKEIGNEAFKLCYQMKKIHLPKKIDFLGKGVFQDCWNLEEIKLPEGVKKIGADLFKGCRSLKSISLPESIEEIEENAFSDCTNLYNLYINPKQYSVLPEEVQNIAALTFILNHAEEKPDQNLKSYLQHKGKDLLFLSIQRNETKAIQYLLNKAELNSDILQQAVLYAGEKKKTEIVAMLLESCSVQNESVESIEDNDWDPFS